MRLRKSIHQGRFTDVPDVFPQREPQPSLRLWQSPRGAGGHTVGLLFLLYIPANIRTISVRCHLDHFPRPVSRLS